MVSTYIRGGYFQIITPLSEMLPSQQITIGYDVVGPPYNFETGEFIDPIKDPAISTLLVANSSLGEDI